MSNKTRREFLQQASLAAAAFGLTTRGSIYQPRLATSQQRNDSFFKEVCILGLDAALGAGASYADVRVVRRRSQYILVNGNNVDRLDDSETLGIGVRVVINGSWGYAAGDNVTRQECRALAEQAAVAARANVRGASLPVELAPVDAYPDALWESPIRQDPFEVAVDEKTDLLLTANDAALAIPSVQQVESSLSFVRKAQTFASTDGSIVEQTTFRSWPFMSVTAVTSDSTDSETRSSHEIAPMARGYEHIVEANLPERANEWAEDAARTLSASPVQPGEYDLILDPSNLSRVIHESIGKLSQLDRAVARGSTYVGPNPLSSPESVIGQLQYGPELMNVIGDRTQLGAVSTVGWDDEGVPQDSWEIIQDGVFVDYQTTREQAPWIAYLTGITHSHGCSVAESWDRVQSQSMPNVSLLPGDEDYLVDDLIAATDHGIFVRGRGAFTFDHERGDFQFGSQACSEVRGGRIVGPLRSVAFRGQTFDFWNSMDMLGGPRSYVLSGIVDEPHSQQLLAGAATHGCPPARFHQCTVINATA